MTSDISLYMQPQEYYAAIGKVEAAGVKVVRDIPLRRSQMAAKVSSQSNLVRLVSSSALISNSTLSRSRLCDPVRQIHRLLSDEGVGGT